ncbi:tripartite tricarboxylate transporter permease [Candidatus Woesearchaeota archaeon]|nr:tripartite tricarboxylate transporter permease [Candidatus Woesearchaeota archaeon]
MIEVIIFILIGILLGTISGLTPGVHINLLSALILTIYSKLTNIDPIIAITTIVSMAITHTFLDFIPSTYLGAPSENTILNILPSHKYLLQGKAYEAIKLSIIGSYFGLILIIIATPLLLIVTKKSYEIIEILIPYVLITTSIVLIFKDKQPLNSLIIFTISGLLGYIVLNLKNINEPLFPLFSGLFGTSSLILSIKEKIKIPNQILTSPKIKIKNLIKNLNLGLFSSILVGFLPGMGSAQAAIISSSINKKQTNEDYIILTSSINSIVLIISLIAMYTINKARSGIIVAIEKITPEMTLNNLFLLIIIILITASLTIPYSLFLAKKFSKYITKINYQYLCTFIIIFIVILTILISKPLGLLILITSTFLGFLPQLLNIPRNQLMGSLLIPVILYYF